MNELVKEDRHSIVDRLLHFRLKSKPQLDLPQWPEELLIAIQLLRVHLKSNPQLELRQFFGVSLPARLHRPLRERLITIASSSDNCAGGN